MKKKELKKRIDELTNDIIILIENKDFVKVEEIKMKWNIILGNESTIMYGNYNNKNLNFLIDGKNNQE
jgi:hypothetical protein